MPPHRGDTSSSSSTTTYPNRRAAVSAKTMSGVIGDCGDGMPIRVGSGGGRSSSSPSRTKNGQGKALLRGTSTRKTTKGGGGRRDKEETMVATANNNTVYEFLESRRAMDDDRCRTASSTAIMTTGAASMHPSEIEDHPSSLEVRTHRTCSLCLRTLPRSQFSDGARLAVNVSLSPGVATCRTCAMTVCAVKLRCMPDNDALLDGYARRGMTMLLSPSGGGMTMGGNGGEDGRSTPPPIAGYLVDGSDRGSELVTRRAVDDASPQRTIMIEDVNSVFYGDRATAGMGQHDRHRRVPDVDRPTNVADCKYLDLLFSMPSYLNLCAFGIFGRSRDISISVAALEAVRLHGTLSGGGKGGDGEGQSKVGGGGGGGYFVPHDCDGRPVVMGREGSDDGIARNEKTRREATTDDVKVDDGEVGIDPRSVVCLVLGEGPTPRTAILASQHWGWTTYAIDPDLSNQWIGRQDDVPGFVGYAGSIGDFMMEEDGNGDRCGGEDGNGTSAKSSSRFGHPPPGVTVRHLVVIGMQPTELSEPVRMYGNGHINDVRSRYDDVPTTLASLSPVRGTTTSLAPLGAERRYHANKLQKDLGYAPNHWYVDEGVFSECREVKVWNFHNAEDNVDDDDGGDGDNYGGGDVIDFKGSVAEGRGLDDNDNPIEEGGSHSKISKKRGDNIPEKNEKESRRPSPGGRTGDRPGKPTKDEIKKSEWLEEQVAQFMTNNKENTTNEHLNDTCTVEDEIDHGKTDDEIDNVSFDDTLTTTSKQSFHSNYSRKIVDNPGGVGLDELAEEEYLEALSPQEIENVLNIMTMHEKQDLFCKPSDAVSLNESHRNAVEYDDNTHEGSSPENDILPDNWEAIFDPESGDYYYTNWDTLEVTWDRPGTSPRLLDDEEGIDAATDSNDAIDTPPLAGHQKSHDVIDLGKDDDDDSTHILIDDESINSGIAALNRWNEPASSPKKSASPGMGNGRVEKDAWSDEGGKDQFDSNPKNILPAAVKRYRSNPWHMNKCDESQSSFVYE
ncbi:hypothetical protein ACHAXA_009018 [Cyclostephanos tholiformis]|uniref:WW domain-containing protein n=1 Tax=Cyclostephanos tholiformis TaxID=382380 RepID=A0ABD3RDG2_9STRA